MIRLPIRFTAGIVLVLCTSFARFLFVILVLVAAGVLPAAETSYVDSATAAADQLKALNDQTIIQSNVWLDTEWDQFKHGAEEATWTLEAYGVCALVTGKTGLCGAVRL